MTIEYNCSRRLIISIVIKLVKTLNWCLNVCKNDKFVHPNIVFCAYLSIWVYRFDGVLLVQMVQFTDLSQACITYRSFVRRLLILYAQTCYKNRFKDLMQDVEFKRAKKKRTIERWNSLAVISFTK